MPTPTLPVARGFTAKLYSLTPGEYQQVSMSLRIDQLQSQYTDGWLTLNDVGIRFRFDYQDTTDGHPRYAVTGLAPGSPHDGGQLEISRGGYLGLYKVSTTGQRWHLMPDTRDLPDAKALLKQTRWSEVFGSSPEDEDFKARLIPVLMHCDQGRSIKLMADEPYLSTTEGSELRLFIDIEGEL